MDYRIVNTTTDDVEFIFSLFDEAIIYQEKNNYPVWKSYDREIILKEIHDKLEYKIISGDEILCVFSVVYADPIIWREKENGNAIYLHRIVVNPKHKGQKHFGKILKWAIEFAKEHHISFIRMDTWANNPVIIDYYKSFGFTHIENVFTPDSPELALQQRNMELALFQYQVS